MRTLFHDGGVQDPVGGVDNPWPQSKEEKSMIPVYYYMQELFMQEVLAFGPRLEDVARTQFLENM